MPTARSGIAAALLGGRMFVFGGEAPAGTFNQAQAYDARAIAGAAMRACRRRGTALAQRRSPAGFTSSRADQRPATRFRRLMRFSSRKASTPRPRIAEFSAAFASTREHRCLVQKGVVADLLDEEIRHVATRDEPACPVAWIDQRAIGVRLRPIGQDHGTDNHPIELAPADDAFLYVLVVIDTPRYR